MSFLIGLLVVVVVGYLVYRKLNKTADSAFDVHPIVDTVKTEVKEVLDVNNDGKVNLADAKEAGKKVKAGAKKAAGKAKAAVKKAKKPKLEVLK